MIDYSYPCMMAENALKDLHNAAIEGRLEDAREHALEAITQARLTYQALNHMISSLADLRNPAAPALAKGVPSRK